MRCSFFELQLDGYVEDTLAAAVRARMDAHLGRCTGCAALLAEFRAIDALLLTPRLLEPAPAFTQTVMHRVRALPAPRARRESILPILGSYIAFGWLTIGAFLFWGGGYARATLALLGAFGAHGAAVLQALAGITARSFGSQAFELTAAMGELLAVDVLVVAAVVALYAVRRARATGAGASKAC